MSTKGMDLPIEAISEDEGAEEVVMVWLGICTAVQYRRRMLSVPLHGSTPTTQDFHKVHVEEVAEDILQWHTAEEGL